MLHERYLPNATHSRRQFNNGFRREADPTPFTALSEITPADKGLLQETVNRFRPHSRNYEDSWGYVIQATRYGGLKWHDPQTGSLIFFGRKSEEDPRLVVPSFFAEPEYLTYAVDKLQNSLKSPQTIVKNVNPEDVPAFLPFGFRPYREGEGWSAEARFDDQTFPQQIVDLQKFMEKRGNVYHQLRKALNKEMYVNIRTYQETDKEDVLEIFALSDENLQYSKEKAKGMYYSSHAMYPTADIDKFVVSENGTGKIVGFLATSDISSQTTALVASLFQPDRKRVSIWSIYQVLVTKYYEGYKLASLGGCETEANYNFKSEKFRPVEQLEKTHLMYDPREKNKPN
jgi:hypothetical protein